MEGRLPDFFQRLETFVSEIEQLWLQVAGDVGEVANRFADASQEIAGQIQSNIEAELEQRCIEFIEPILEIFLEFETVLDEATQPVMHTIEPTLVNHPACIGCRHYHGQVYSDVLLICAMHPYGCDGEQCPDWESVWKIEG
jgi:hypothetical protein